MFTLEKKTCSYWGPNEISTFLSPNEDLSFIQKLLIIRESEIPKRTGSCKGIRLEASSVVLMQRLKGQSLGESPLFYNWIIREKAPFFQFLFISFYFEPVHRISFVDLIFDINSGHNWSCQGKLILAKNKCQRFQKLWTIKCLDWS